MEGEGQGIVACGRILALGLLTFCFVFAAAAIEIPKASGKALGVTRGKPFEKGLVFVNGRYLESPYVVERWGTGIRINKVPVIGQVVDWTEFLKTQDGVKVIKTEVPPPQAAERAPEAVSSPEPVSAPPEKEIAGSDDFDPSLDDLFEDEPQPQKKKADVPQAKPVARKPKSVKPIPTVTYALEGEFSANDASKALLKKVNDKRTQINAQLLDGEILFFPGRGGCIPCGRLT